MAIIDGSGSEHDLMQLWSVITELGEQLSQNRSMSVSLYGLAGKIKVRLSNIRDKERSCICLPESSYQLADRICPTEVCSLTNVLLYNDL